MKTATTLQGLLMLLLKLAAIKMISQWWPESLESAAHLKEVRLIRGLSLFNQDFQGWSLN